MGKVFIIEDDESLRRELANVLELDGHEPLICKDLAHGAQEALAASPDAAVLAIQQLSETADSLGRYRRLSDLGCDMRQILGSLCIQTVVYFCAPLALAACHTACAVLVVSGTLFSELGVDPTKLIGLAAGAIVGIYAVYLVTTYLLSKSIVSGSLLHRRAA
jgi:hypothetical protein